MMRWHLLALCLGSLLLLSVPAWASDDAARASRVGPTPAQIADLVLPYGYPLEEHFATTDDGYILRMHRIPHGSSERQQQQSLEADTPSYRRALRMATHKAAAAGASIKQAEGSDARPVVLLHHGLLDSAAGFLVLGPGKALGLVLADAGFDVWLANARGNTQSRNHTTLSTASAEYWAFSFDEMAEFDLPAELDLIQDVTGQTSVSLVGFSQGGTVALTALASQPELADRISAAVLLAPAAFLKHTKSVPLTVLSSLSTPEVFTLLGPKEFLPSQGVIALLEGTMCFVTPKLCANILAAICGFNDASVDPGKLPMFLKYTPAGASVQNIAHWAQCVKHASPHTLAHFDYGSDCRTPRPGSDIVRCNRLEYESSEPPAYPLNQISTPLMLVTGGMDRLADPLDIAALRHSLDPAALHVDLKIPNFEHLDFIWAETANERVYQPLIDFLLARTPEAAAAADEA